ncbi:hypothetical protein JCM8202v2_004709 [Rhodotorula sphaerocarpa]
MRSGVDGQGLPAGLATVLLLGGQSRRMGMPKHLLLHPATQQPLYRHHLDLLLQLDHEKGAFPEGVWVSARREQLAELDLPPGVKIVIDDREKNGDIGPAAGILQAAASLPEATWLVLAVDLPFLSTTSVLHLLRAHAASPAAPVSLFLHSDDGNPEPLFSVWTPPALAQLRKNCAAGKSGPCRAAKDVLGGKVVEGKGGVKVPTEDWITDADTQQEWEEAQKRLTGLAAHHPCFVFARGLRLDLVCRSYRIAPAAIPNVDLTAVPLPLAFGGRLASDVRALLPHPLEDSSAMDGYAVRSSDLATASPEAPAYLRVLGRIEAGDPRSKSVERASDSTAGCWEIMTGAVFPSEDFDAVVKVEDAVASSVPLATAPPSHTLPLKGRVGILATGKEVVPLEGAAELAPGQVIDCITPFLGSLLRARGYETVLLPSSEDSSSAIGTALFSALTASEPDSTAGALPFDLLITIAGVSLGSADHTPHALSNLGIRTIFHGVSMRPGGPVMLSVHEGTGTPILSLPGNPMASAVAMRSFGEELLRGLEGDGEGGAPLWTELDLRADDGGGGGEGGGGPGWRDWISRLKPGVSTFAAFPSSSPGDAGTLIGPPTLAGTGRDGGKRTGPCAVGSLIGADCWVRADRTSDLAQSRAYWRSMT